MLFENIYTSNVVKEKITDGHTTIEVISLTTLTNTIKPVDYDGLEIRVIKNQVISDYDSKAKTNEILNIVTHSFDVLKILNIACASGLPLRSISKFLSSGYGIFIPNLKFYLDNFSNIIIFNNHLTNNQHVCQLNDIGDIISFGELSISIITILICELLSRTKDIYINIVLLEEDNGLESSHKEIFDHLNNIRPSFFIIFVIENRDNDKHISVVFGDRVKGEYFITVCYRKTKKRSKNIMVFIHGLINKAYCNITREDKSKIKTLQCLGIFLHTLAVDISKISNTTIHYMCKTLAVQSSSGYLLPESRFQIVSKVISFLSRPAPIPCQIIGGGMDNNMPTESKKEIYDVDENQEVVTNDCSAIDHFQNFFESESRALKRLRFINYNQSQSFPRSEKNALSLHLEQSTIQAEAAKQQLEIAKQQLEFTKRQTELMEIETKMGVKYMELKMKALQSQIQK